MTTLPILAALLALALFFALTRLRVVTVQEYEQGLRIRRGVVRDVLGPGRYRAFGPATELVVVDRRERTLTVAGQEVLSADRVPVKLSLALAYRVNDVRAARAASQGCEEALYLEAQLALRTAAAAVELEALLADRAGLDAGLSAAIAPEAARLGLALERVALKDVMVGGELKRALGDVAKARAEARARLERARGETASLRNLTNAARLVAGHAGLYELRLLETARESAGQGSSLVIGLPDGVRPNPSRTVDPDTKA